MKELNKEYLSKLEFNGWDDSMVIIYNLDTKQGIMYNHRKLNWMEISRPLMKDMDQGYPSPEIPSPILN